MVSMRQIWPFLVLLLHYASVQSFEISRPVTGLDTFNVPSFMCGGSRYRCSSFYAEEQASTCFCSCPATNSTFTFSNNRWMCMENAQARDKFQQGCEARTTFVGQKPDNRLPSLTIGSRAEISMRYWLWEYWTCTLDISSSWFIGCNGSKVLFTQQYHNAASQLFSITRRTTADRYVLEVPAGRPGSNLLQGKIINLAMKCGSSGLIHVTIDICLLMKIEGKETCPVDEPTNSMSSSIQPLTTMYSHGSTSSRLESTFATPMISHNTPSVDYVSTLASSDATQIVSSTTPAPHVATSETLTTSSIDLHTSFRTSAISSSASVSSQVAAYSSRKVSSSRRVFTSDISSTALFSSPKPFSLRTSVTSLTDSYITKKTVATPTVVSETSWISFDNSVTLLPTTLETIVRLPAVSTEISTASLTLLSRKASDSSQTAGLWTPSIASIKRSDDTQKVHATSVKSKESATLTTGNLPTLDATPTTSLRLSTTSRSSPKASTSSSKVSSVTANGGVKVEILPTTLNVLPTVRIPPVVVEVGSPTINEGVETPILPPPTEAGGVEPTTFEPNIPPNVGSGRKGQNNGLYIGVSTGITVLIIITLAIVGFFMYRRRCSNVQPRARSLSEETKVSVLASPRNSTFGVEEADDTLRRSSMYVPNYGIPLWEDEPDNGPIYAVIRFPEGANPEATNDDEPFYYVLEQAEVNDKELEDSTVTEDPALSKPGPQFKEDHIYAEVDFSKKRLAKNSTDMSELINSRENSSNSEVGTEPVLEVLKPYVRSVTESEESENGSEKPVYFTLEECFSDTFKRINNDSECENAPVRKRPEGPDQYKAICTEALVYYTLNRCGSGRQNNNSNNNNNSKFTIGQVFDQLEERYLNNTEQTGTPLPARPGLLLPRRISGKKDNSDPKGANEPVPVVYNFFEEICSNGPPKYRAVTNHEGPVYFHLKRLKSNHSRATRIQPKWEDEPIYTVLGEQYLKGAEGKDKPEDKHIYLTLEELCSDTLKRPSIDCQDTEPTNDDFNECNPRGTEEGNRSQRPGCYTMKRVYPNSGKKSNDESPC